MIALVALLAAAIAPLADPEAEARAQALEREIRCVACENEPISQSTAPIAADMRALVRARVAEGESDAEIRAFFRERYGDFVLLRPPLAAHTLALWAAPAALAALIGFIALRNLRRPADALEPEADEER